MEPIQFLNKFMKGTVQPEQIKTDFSYISESTAKEGFQKVQELTQHYNQLKIGRVSFKNEKLRKNLFIVQNVFNRAADALYLHQKLKNKKIFDLRSKTPENSTRDEMEAFGNLHAIESSAVNCFIVPETILPEGSDPLFITAVVNPILSEIEGIQASVESMCTKEIDQDVLALSLSYEAPISGLEAKDMGYAGLDGGGMATRSVRALYMSEEIGLKKLEKPKDMDLETFKKLQKIYNVHLKEMQVTMTKIKNLFTIGIDWVVQKKRKLL